MPHGLEGFKIGPYSIGAKLGEGASATVFRASSHADTRPDVAIKIMPEEKATPINADRFLRAAKLSAPLRHPNIVSVLDYGKIDGLGWYMVLELVDGEDLSDMLKRGVKLSVEQACQWTLELLDALQEAHTLDVLHRDIKPANILIKTREDGTKIAKLTDFGLAKMSNTPAGGVGALTQDGHIVGTPLYMAPEQLDATKVCRATDLYSLGLVFYEMFTGTQAVPGDTLEKILLNQLNPAFHIDVRHPNIPQQFYPTLQSACAKDLSARFSNTDQFAKSLRQGLERWKSSKTYDEGRQDPVPRFTPTPNASERPPLIGLAETIQDLSQHPQTHRTESSSSPSQPRDTEFAAGVIRPDLSEAQHVQGAPKKSKKLLFFTLSLLLALCTAAVAVAALQDPVSFAPTHNQADADALLKQGWNKLALPVPSPNLDLVAYHGPPRSKSKQRLLLILHDLNTPAEKHALQLDPLRDEGIALFTFGQRGFSKSPGEPSEKTFFQDARVALEKARKMYPKSSIYIYGTGVGATVATSFTGKPKVAGVIAESPVHTLQNPIRAWIPNMAQDPVFAIPSKPTKQASALLVLYGEEDARTTKKQAQKLCKILDQRVSSCALSTIPGAGHDDIIDVMGPSHYIRRLERFVR